MRFECYIYFYIKYSIYFLEIYKFVYACPAW